MSSEVQAEPSGIPFEDAFSIEVDAEDCKLVREVTGCFGLVLQGDGEGSMSEDRAANIDASRG